MTNVMQPDRMFYGTPADITVDGEHFGTTFTPPRITVEYETNADKTRPQGARSKIKGLLFVKSAICTARFTVNEFMASKFGWVLPGASITNTPSVGAPLSGGNTTTLAANPALGATNLKVTEDSGFNANEFYRIGPASPTEADSEVLQVVTVGTEGSGGTGVDFQNDQGGGARIDHADAEEVVEVFGTTIALDVAAGAVNVKITSVGALAPGDILRFGDFGEYETRALTAVGTGGAGGTGVTFLEPLSRAHDAGDWAIEVTALGQSTIQPVAGRMPSSAYKNVVFTGLGLDGLPLITELDSAISVENLDIPMGDDDWAGFAVALEAYGDKDNPSALPWRFKIGATV